MTKTITVSSSVDDSKKLQKLIDNTGNTPTEYIFSKDNDIEIISPIRFYGNLIVNGGGAVFHLTDKAPESLFPSMTPILGAKSNGGSGYEFSGLVFDGNSDHQTVPLGKGFHNLIGLSGASDIKIHDIHLHDSAGDMARLANVKKVRYNKNKVIRCGHDGLYVDGGYDVEADDNYTEIRTNSAVRLRHVKGGKVRRNVVKNKVGGAASCPGFQFETSLENRYSSDILVEDNEVSDTWGPGAWVICRANPNKGAATGITFRGNTFTNCGNMDSSYHHIPGVGGLVFDCWDKIVVENNTFKDCKGYGVLFGDYVNAGDVGANLSATIRNNKFIGTKKSNTVGTASGTAIANLKSERYTSVVARENSYSGNVRDLYNVTETPAAPTENPAFLKVTCLESQIKAIKNIIANRTILRKLEK